MTRTQAVTQSTETLPKANMGRYLDAGVKGGREMGAGSGYVNPVPRAKVYSEREGKPGTKRIARKR